MFGETIKNSLQKFKIYVTCKIVVKNIVFKIAKNKLHTSNK